LKAYVYVALHGKDVVPQPHRVVYADAMHVTSNSGDAFGARDRIRG
jgi:hypothetical protein